MSSIRSAVSAGEPLNQEVIDTFKKTFSLEVRDGYGQTENTLLVGTMLGMEARPGSMGKPTPGNRVEIIDDNGNPASVGEVGDIAVHVSTPALFKEYLNDPERTSMQFRGEYYVTGDRAKMDEDGYFWFEGRGDDIILAPVTQLDRSKWKKHCCNIRQLKNVQLSQALMQYEAMSLKHLLFFVIQGEKMKKA